MAFQKKEIDFHFPVLGMDRRLPGKNSQPGTSPNISNVRPDDSEEERLRGGSRPGLSKSFAQLTGSGARIQHVGQLNTVTEDPIGSFVDDFEGSTLEANWFQPIMFAEIINNPDPYEQFLPVLVGEGFAKADYRNREFRSFSDSKAVFARPEIEGVDPDRAQEWNIIVKNTVWTGQGKGLVQLFLKMEENPVVSNYPGTEGHTGTYEVAALTGLIVQFLFKGGTRGIVLPTSITYNISEWYTTTIPRPVSSDIFTSGTVAVTTTPDTTIRVTLNGNALELFVNGVSIKALTLHANTVALSSQRWGLSLEDIDSSNTGLGTVGWGIDRISYLYNNLLDLNQLARHAMVISNGELWVENNIEELVLDTSTAGLNANVQLQAIESLSKYYIADYGDQRAQGEAGSLNTTGLLLDDSTASFDTDGINVSDHIVSIYSASLSGTTTTLGQYTILAVTSGTRLTLNVAANTDGSTADPTISYRVERGPKVYDPALAAGSRLVAFVNTDIVTNGNVPVGNKLITRYRDRVCFTGDIHNPHLWWQARAGAPTDWQYFPANNNVARAVAGQNSEAGAIGDLITSQIPHSDDYLIYGSANSMWVLRGDAAAGGSIDSISRDIGMLSADAWAYGPESELIFLTRDGIYTNERGVSAPIKSISREKLPQELRDIDPNLFHVSMAYDIEERGIHIMVSAFDSAVASSHFYLSWPLRGFFPVDFNTIHDPFAVWNYTASDTSRSATILGCRDGYVREFDFNNQGDDGIGFKSIVAIGPEYLSEGISREGILKFLSVDVDDDSSDVKVTVIQGKNHAEAIDKANAYIAERV